MPDAQVGVRVGAVTIGTGQAATVVPKWTAPGLVETRVSVKQPAELEPHDGNGQLRPLRVEPRPAPRGAGPLGLAQLLPRAAVLP